MSYLKERDLALRLRVSVVKIVFFVFILLLAGCAHLPPEKAAAEPFRFEKHRLGFANETVWNYVDGEVSGQRDKQGARGDHYTRRCFVVCRATVQFWKFARFEPHQKSLDEVTLAKRIREVADTDVWRTPFDSKARIVFPGYSTLREISAAHPKVFQENMGLGWPVYFRVGNMPMLIPPTRSNQENLCSEIQKDLKAGYPTILWIVNFPSLTINHAIVVYGQSSSSAQKITFNIYDPNDAEASKKLCYNRKTKTFSYNKTFYFKGGTVDVRPLYRSPVQ